MAHLYLREMIKLCPNKWIEDNFSFIYSQIFYYSNQGTYFLISFGICHYIYIALKRPELVNVGDWKRSSCKLKTSINFQVRGDI